MISTASPYSVLQLASMYMPIMASYMNPPNLAKHLIEAADHDLTLDRIKTDVGTILGETKGDVVFKSGVILLAALRMGPNRIKISTFTGYPQSVVGPIATRFRESGIWDGYNGQSMCYEWLDDEVLKDDMHFSIAFTLDCFVGAGILKREPDKSGARYGIT